MTSRATTRLRRLVVVLLGPLWVRTFRDPVRDGHLRLDSLSRPEKHLARCGLVLLALLLVSVLFADVWRAGPLLQLAGTLNDLNFAPAALLPVTLLGLLLAWTLLCWGALDASPAVRVLVAVAYLATTANFGIASVGLGLGSWIFENLGTLVRIGYFGVAGALVLSALLHPLVRTRPRLAKGVTGVLRGVVVVALLVEFGAFLWAHVESERHGFPTLVPGLVDGSIFAINALLVPLVYVAAVAVVDFALDVSSSLSEPARVLRRRWLLAVLLAVLGLKVLVQGVMDRDVWAALVRYQPEAFVRTVVAVALLALLVAAVTRFPPSDDYQLAKERTMYGGSFVLAASYLLVILGTGLGLFTLGQLKSDIGNDISDRIPYGWLGLEGTAIAAGIVVAVGVVLMRRSPGGFGDELGSALIVVGAWSLGFLVPNALGLELGFSFPTVDAVVTVGVLAVLLLRWRSLSAAALLSLTTLLIFSWLVMSRGDYISFLGGLVGLPAILVVVFGVVLTLASGSAFASAGSKRLPTDARPLLFVGYLLLSVVILHWVEVTHEAGQDVFSLVGFQYVGIPMAAWLAGRRILAHTAPSKIPDPVSEPSQAS
jgi:hypothetical protein